MSSPSRRLLVLGTLLVTVVVCLASLRSTVSATPDYARQTGKPCPVCHVRLEGGGELTPAGEAFVRNDYQWPAAEASAGSGAQPIGGTVIEPGVATAPGAVVTAAPEPGWRIPRALRLIAGYIHVATAVAWLGTIFYVHVIIGAKRLTSGIPRAERRVGWTGIVLMAVTGTILTLYRYQQTGTVFSGTFDTVFAIKLVQYGLMVVLALLATTVVDRRMRAAAQAPPVASGDAAGVGMQTLASFDGQQGRKGVIAVDGKLYDVSASRLWQDGVHMRKHRAGQELGAALEGAPHGREVLERVSLVGELASAAPARPAPPRAQRLFVAMAYANLLLALGILLCVAWWKWGFALRPASTETAAVAVRASLSSESQQCVQCHTTNPFLAAQIAEWGRSKHSQNEVGCYECHQATVGEADAMDHNGFTVSALVTPNDCARCHILQTEQFASSRHAQGGDILDSLDNVLGEQVEGVAATVLGCQQCHGSIVEVDNLGIPLPASWPNTGIGRINPDGSRGACSTCHTRHLFSVAVAREPASCGNCHLGPDHPQKEIYEESKHGVAFVANREQMALDAQPWVLSEDYTAAPTCATCHMSAVPGIGVNHDVGLRISWTLRPEVSVRQEDWETRRQQMGQVCANCHSPVFASNFFQQFDAAVNLYNVKFALPASAIMADLRAAGRLTPQQFDETIEWTFFYLWHHEGRRARHGAAMMGPDYVQWHGFFEVADRFYNELLAQAEDLLPGVTASHLQAEEHLWLQPE